MKIEKLVETSIAASPDHDSTLIVVYRREGEVMRLSMVAEPAAMRVKLSLGGKPPYKVVIGPVAGRFRQRPSGSSPITGHRRNFSREAKTVLG